MNVKSSQGTMIFPFVWPWMTYTDLVSRERSVLSESDWRHWVTSMTPREWVLVLDDVKTLQTLSASSAALTPLPNSPAMLMHSQCNVTEYITYHYIFISHQISIGTGYFSQQASCVAWHKCISMSESKTSFGWDQWLMRNVRLFIWFSFHYNCLLVHTCLLYVRLSHCILSVCCLMANKYLYSALSFIYIMKQPQFSNKVDKLATGRPRYDCCYHPHWFSHWSCRKNSQKICSYVSTLHTSMPDPQTWGACCQRTSFAATVIVLHCFQLKFKMTTPATKP